MHDTPDPDALLDIVAETLREEIAPLLVGSARYHVLIAANLIAVVRRQLALEPELMRAEVARLQDILDTQEGDLAMLTQMLATALRDEELDRDDPRIGRHLALTSRDKLRVDQPKFLRHPREPRRK